MGGTEWGERGRAETFLCLVADSSRAFISFLRNICANQLICYCKLTLSTL